MSDDSMRETVAEEAAEQIDVATLISGDNIQEGVNGKEMGIAIGRWAGERLGRSAGETVGMTLHEIFSSGPEHRNFWEICVDTKEGAVSWISNRTDEGREQIEEAEERIEEGQERVKEEAEERIEEGQERIEEGREQIEEGQERVKEEAAEVTDDLPSLEDIDRETLDEMSDQDLEAVAQDAGVKADQAREEMTTKILDAVPGHEEGEEEDDEEEEEYDGTTGHSRDFS